jgi:small GTP-binding protein
MTQQHKLIFVGNGGEGKTVFIQRLLGEQFNKRYLPTPINTRVYPIEFNEAHVFNIWDIGGQSVLKDFTTDYTGADCAIIMLSDNKIGVKMLKTFQDRINLYCGNIPTLIVFNKCDLARTVENYNQLIQTENNVLLCSAKNQFQLDSPFQKLIDMMHN